MSDDRRLNIRASLYPLIEAAAARRHVPVASFVAMVLSEYLLKHDELNSVKPTSVAPKRGTTSTSSIVPDSVAQRVLADWGEDD